MSGTYSLRLRLSIGLVTGITVMWLVGVIAAGFVVRHELDEAFDSALQETAQRLLSLAATDILDSNETPLSRRIPSLHDHDEYLTYVVRNSSGQILLQSHDADLDAFRDSPRIGFRSSGGYRLYGESAVSGTIFIEIAEPLEHRREATLESTISLVVPLALFLPISVFGVWWLVRRSMRDVLVLKDQIEARGAGDLSAVSTSNLPNEVQPIAESVNLLLARLARSIEAERSFTANAAHELRTPIAGALALVQRLVASLEEPELRQRANDVAATLNKIARISEKLLQLARAEGGGVIASKVSDLAPILDAVVEEFLRSSGAGARLDYQKSANMKLLARIDPDAFGILMRNLIENALKYSSDNFQVYVSVNDRRISIINSCPVLSENTLAELTKPFARGQSEKDGSGLGLAIVRAIAEKSDISVVFNSPATGRHDGFEARIEIGSEKAS